MGRGEPGWVGWEIGSPSSTWVNMNYLNRKSDLNLGWHSGNSHVDWDWEKRTDIFSPRGTRTEEIAALLRTHWENLCLGC